MRIKHYLLVILGIIVVPVVVNLILFLNNPLATWLPSVGVSTDWIGFWGNFAGAIVGGLIVLVVLYYTIKENIKMRDVQIRTIKYTQQQSWLDNLRKQLIDNYKMFDMQSFSIGVNALQRGAYNDAISILLSINRNIEFQANSSSLYFLVDDPATKEIEYNACLKSIMIEFGCLINDLIFITPLLTNKANGIDMTPESIVTLAQNSYNIIVDSAKFDSDTVAYYKDKSALSKIAHMKVDDTFGVELDNIIIETLMSSSEIHARKYGLIASTERVLRYENQRIEKILE